VHRLYLRRRETERTRGQRGGMIIIRNSERPFVRGIGYDIRLCPALHDVAYGARDGCEAKSWAQAGVSSDR
jgi:hypothetical protein